MWKFPRKHCDWIVGDCESHKLGIHVSILWYKFIIRKNNCSTDLERKINGWVCLSRTAWKLRDRAVAENYVECVRSVAGGVYLWCKLMRDYQTTPIPAGFDRPSLPPLCFIVVTLASFVSRSPAPKQMGTWVCVLVSWAATKFQVYSRLRAMSTKLTLVTRCLPTH